jgi:hypothetical protein
MGAEQARTRILAPSEEGIFEYFYGGKYSLDIFYEYSPGGRFVAGR